MTEIPPDGEYAPYDDDARTLTIKSHLRKHGLHVGYVHSDLGTHTAFSRVCLSGSVDPAPYVTALEELPWVGLVVERRKYDVLVAAPICGCGYRLPDSCPTHGTGAVADLIES